MEIYQTKDVFTPTKPARVAFIDRDAINERLVNALQMPGKQLIVYGHSGSGKTTLLANKLCQLYENHITSHCMKGMTFDQLILNAFDQLEPYFTSEKVTATKNTLSADLVSAYSIIQSKINASETTEKTKKEQRVLPPQLSPQALGKFLGSAKCCWILEDFHKMDDSEKARLSQLMKVFMDLSDHYDDLKIVALGAVDTARQVVEYDPEMRNRVAEIRVDLMTDTEIEGIIEKGETALNILFAQDLKALVARYSNGLASVCHHLCLYMCQAVGVGETSATTVSLEQTHFEAAIKLYVEEASDSIRGAFDLAFKQRRKTKLDNVSIVLESLCSFKERGASRADMLIKIRKKHPKYPESSLKATLKKLSMDDYGSIIRINNNSGLCSFSDPFYRVYAMAHFHKMGQPQSVRVSGELDLSKFFKMLETEFSKGGVKVVFKEVAAG